MDADDLGTPINKTSSNSGGNINNLKPQDVNLSDFTQKGGKIDNFAEATSILMAIDEAVDDFSCSLD